MPVDEKNVYAQDAYKNLFLTMTKEQILTAILNAVNEGTLGDIDAGFVTKIQEINDLRALRFWVGTMAEFHALEEKDSDTLYLFTDDPTLNEIQQAITELEQRIETAQTYTFDTASFEVSEDNDVSMKGASETTFGAIRLWVDENGVCQIRTTKGSN